MKTNREYKRKFPWFSASLGVIALACVITLFVSGQLNAGRGDFGVFMTRMFNNVIQGQSPLAQSPVYHVNLADMGHEDGVVISGFPAYASARLPLVRDRETKALRLILSGEQDVSAQAVTALRVTVNGRRVIERVLAPGRREFRWVFDLTEEFAGASEAQVAFQLMGDLPEGLCHDQRSVGALIAFDGQSGVELELDGPIDSLRDVMALTPHRVKIATASREPSEGYLGLAIRLGARLTRAGYQVDMIDLDQAVESPNRDGLFLIASPERLRQYGFERLQSGAQAGTTLWQRKGKVVVALSDPERIETVRFLTSELLPIARADSVDPVLYTGVGQIGDRLSLTALNVDTDVQRVSDGREWRFDYDLAQLPGGRLPTHLQLDLRLPADADDVTNVAHVALNGALIDSQRLESGRVNTLRLELPSTLQKLHNTVSISLQRDHERGGCEINRQRYPVQLLESSSLFWDNDQFGAGFTSLPRAFANLVDVRMPAYMEPGEDLPAARLAANAIAAFVPATSQINFIFEESENGIAGPADRPFISIDTTPSNVSAPLRIYADRVVIESDGQGGVTDVRALSDLSVFQAVKTRTPQSDVAADANLPAPTAGLIVHAIDDAPVLGNAPLGQERVVIIPSPGEMVIPQGY
ncbi:hypothetical protein [Woodsholea maritima]|uniref:hypothetical protein n=1 Tax=Woodsholea maritima TaxID=240237 RepID=UPI0003741530|nr:hypothetical protein [Woodsholea maritima]